jgi:PAS domain S-box-containing protein
MQTAAARTKAGEEVSVTVAYTQEAPAEHEVLFLAEEQTLLEAAVARLVDTVDWAQASREQADHEQMLATMFAQSTDAISVIDPGTGRFVDFNFEAHALLGYSREEFAGLSVADVAAEYDPAGIGEVISKVMAGAMVDLQTKSRHKDGRLLDTALTLRGVMLHGERYLSAVWRDVTEQRAHEREALELVERLRLQSRLLGRISTSGPMVDGRFAEFSAEVTESLARSLGIPFVSVWLFSEDGSRLECLDAYDRAAARHSRDLVIETAAFPDEVRAHRAARYVDAGDALSDPRTAALAEGSLHPGRVTALLDAAIVSAGRVRGLLSIGCVDGPEEWSSDETAFACQVADQLGMALLNRDRLDAALLPRAACDDRDDL